MFELGFLTFNRTKENYLGQFGYVHYVINHSVQFVSEFSNTIHINTVERLWGIVKSYIKMLRPKIHIDDYLAKFYLNRLYNKPQLFNKIIQILSDARVSN